jgi:ankyrin repeat protein
MSVDTSAADLAIQPDQSVRETDADDGEHVNLHKYLKKDKFDKLSRLLEKYPKLVDQVDSSGRSLLHVAASRGLTLLVLALLQIGAKVDLLDKHQNTALHYACCDEHNEIVKLLIEYKATVNVRDASGKEPIHLSCNQGNLETVRLLLLGGADPFAIDNRKNTILHLIAARGHGNLAPTLLNALRNSTHSMQKVVEFINRTDWFGDTALHWACRTPNADIAVALIEAGASTNVRNSFKKLPLDYCSKNVVLSEMLEAAIQRVKQDSMDDIDANGAADSHTEGASGTLHRNSLSEYNIESTIENFESEIQTRKSLKESLEQLRIQGSGKDRRGAKLLARLSPPPPDVIYDFKVMGNRRHTVAAMQSRSAERSEVGNDKENHGKESKEVYIPFPFSTVDVSSVDAASDNRVVMDSNPMMTRGAKPSIKSPPQQSKRRVVSLSEMTRSDMIRRDIAERERLRQKAQVGSTGGGTGGATGQSVFGYIESSVSGLPGLPSLIRGGSSGQAAAQGPSSSVQSPVRSTSDGKEDSRFGYFFRRSSERPKENRDSKEMKPVGTGVGVGDLVVGSPHYSELHGNKEFSFTPFNGLNAQAMSTRNPMDSSFDSDRLSQGTSEDQSSTQQSLILHAPSSIYNSDSDSEIDFEDLRQDFSFRDRTPQSTSTQSRRSRGLLSGSRTRRSGQGQGHVRDPEVVFADGDTHGDASDHGSQNAHDCNNTSRDSSASIHHVQEVVSQTCTVGWRSFRGRLQAMSRYIGRAFTRYPTSAEDSVSRARSGSANVLLEQKFTGGSQL